MLKVVHEESASHEGDGSSGASLLDQIVRDGARQMLAAALQAEAACYVEAFADEVDEAGRRMVVRNGHHQPREVTTANGHIKIEYPHLLAIEDPATLRAEITVVREHYNTIRLHAGIGYVTPDDEHEGRGEAIRKAREAGLEQARLRRLATHRAEREDTTSQGPADVV